LLDGIAPLWTLDGSMAVPYEQRENRTVTLLLPLLAQVVSRPALQLAPADLAFESYKIVGSASTGKSVQLKKSCYH
jgi:hypothetical protein